MVLTSYLPPQSGELCLSPSRLVLVFGVVVVVLVVALTLSCVLWVKARRRVMPRARHPRHPAPGPYMVPHSRQPYIRVQI